MNKLVSIIIPTWNRGYCLKQSIDSILSQTYKNFEIIIIDDNSTDNTENLIKSIDDSRIRYFRNESNCGAGKSRNIGVRQAKGELIAFHDSDDIWHNDKLEKQLILLEKDHKLDFVFSWYQVINNNHITLQIKPSELEKNKVFDCLLAENFIGTPTMLMKKTVFEKIGGFDESLKTLEDWEFALRISEKFKVSFVDEVLVDVIDTKNSVNKAKGLDQFISHFCIFSRFWTAYKEHSSFSIFFINLVNLIFNCTEQDKQEILTFVLNNKDSLTFLNALITNYDIYSKNKDSYFDKRIHELTEYAEELNEEMASQKLILNEQIENYKFTVSERDKRIQELSKYAENLTQLLTKQRTIGK